VGEVKGGNKKEKGKSLWTDILKGSYRLGHYYPMRQHKGGARVFYRWGKKEDKLTRKEKDLLNSNTRAKRRKSSMSLLQAR